MDSTDIKQGQGITGAPGEGLVAAVPTLHDRIADAIKTYLADKDLSQTPHHVAYRDLFPDQVMPGLFEQIFDDVVTDLTKAK